MNYLVMDRRGAVSQAASVFCPDPSYQVIGQTALRNNIRIREAILPAVCVIENQAFCNCTALRDVEFGQLAVVKKEAFSGCSQLRKITFPTTLKRLDSAAFRGCTRLKEISFTDRCSCGELPEQIFSECRRLDRVELPFGLRVIGERAFDKCESLVCIDFPDTLRKIGKGAFSRSGLKEACLPESLLTISEEAFLKCRNLEYVRIPKSVRKIGRWAFHGCSRMEVLEIYHDPQEIGEWITNKSCTIRCPRGSRMEAYARAYGMEVELLDA